MRTRDMVYIALFAAVVAALGLLPPVTPPFIPVPITAQTLGVMLAGSVIGARRGALALVLFLLLVAAGMPLLAGGRGGLGVYFGPTGGFLLSWPLGAFVVGWLVEHGWSRLNVPYAFAFNVVGGIVVVYMIGIPWLAAVSGLSLSRALLGSVVFVPGDLIKAAVAAWVAVTVKRAYPIIKP